MNSNRVANLDLNLFKVFVAVYNQRNLTQAGVTLGMAQPAVSRALNRLRDALGDRLFYRVDGEMRATRFAELMAPGILDGMARLEFPLDLDAARGEAPVPSTYFKLGLNDYLSATLLPVLLERLHARMPHVFLTTIGATYESAPDQVLREQVDCAVVSSCQTADRIASEPLFEEDYVAVCAAGHPLSHKLHWSIDDYLGHPHLLVSYTAVTSGWVDDKLKVVGRHRQVRASVNLYTGVAGVLRSLPYICTVPRRLASTYLCEGLTTHELPFESHRHQFHLVWARHMTGNRLSQSLRDEIIKASQMLS